MAISHAFTQKLIKQMIDSGYRKQRDKPGEFFLKPDTFKYDSWNYVKHKRPQHILFSQ